MSQTPPLIPSDSNDVTILPPDYTLKKIIGENVDVKKIFSPENVAKAQGVIETHKDSFLEWVKADMATIEEHYRHASANPTGCEMTIRKLSKTAFVIKSQAGTFGFSLGTRIAKSLDDFCNRDFRPTADHLLVVRKHVDALQTIFSKQISGDGGALGNELCGNLDKLVAKYRDKK